MENHEHHREHHHHHHHHHHHRTGNVVGGEMNFRTLKRGGDSATSAREEVRKMNAFKLIAAALASVIWQDASGKTITPPAGSTAVWTSSDETFATVAPQGDGLSSAIVSAVDPTGATDGSSVITCTFTNPDGSQAIVTGAVANSDDVVVGTMTFGPVPASAKR